MKQLYTLALISLSLLLAPQLQAQNFLLTRSIIVTDTIDNGGVALAVSSDDAEQENDEIDALHDDDLDAGWEGAPEDQNILTTGLRFRSIEITAGARIDSAFIVVYAHEGKSSDDIAQITIAGCAEDDAGTFTESALIDARSRTSASVLWEVDEEWEIWEPYRTPDIRSIVQEIVDRSGWKTSNDMAFMLLGQNQGPSDFENAREFESFENISDPEDGGDGQNHPERVPQLIVYYSVESAFVEIPVMFTDTIDDGGVKLAVSSDDAEQQNDEIDALFDDDLDAGWEGAPEDQNILTIGIRFRNIPVPQGSRIDSAFLVVYAHEGKSAEDVALITIVGEASDDTQTFTETALIDARPQTIANILWEVAEEWEIWQPYRTPDISEVIEEIIARDGWEAGNNLSLILLGENQGPSDFENAREFESFENIADPEDGGDGQNHPERVPHLLIYYSSPNTSAVTNVITNVKPLIVFPNPVSQDHLTVQFEREELPALVHLIDLNGQVVRMLYSHGGSEVHIPVLKLPAGTYVVRALQGDQWYLQKVLVH